MEKNKKHKLKVYRIVEHPYLASAIFGDNRFESLLYCGGYTMLRPNAAGDPESSNIYNRGIVNGNELSKYFFVFPEDLYSYSSDIFGSIIGNILEYVGIGHGHLGQLGSYAMHPDKFALETIVKPEEFTGERVNFKDISREEKLEMVYKLAVDSINYSNYIKRCVGVKELELSDYDDIMKHELKEYQIRDFLDSNRDIQLVKSKEITGNMYSMFHRKKVQVDDKYFIQSLEDQGLKLDYSEEAKNARLAIAKSLGFYYDRSYSECQTYEEYCEKAKKMIIEYNNNYGR